jgi:DNA repair protein RecN (Recombination protein N)
MLSRLKISNYGIIAAVDIDFADQLNIITGETGAGKSILLGALGLLLGRRADTKVLFDESKKCVVEGVFRIGALKLQPFFDAHDLDYGDECIIRREISTSGKSRAFINDTPVTLDILRDLSAQLVELHQQFDTLDLNRESFQLTLLDALAGQLDRVADFHEKYAAYSRKRQRLQDLQASLQEQRNQQDYLQFQYEELEKAAFASDEQEQLESDQTLLSSSEDIRSALGQLEQSMTGGEFPVEDQLGAINSELSRIRHVHPKLEELAARMDSVHAEIKDIGAEAERLMEDFEYDPARLQEIDERLALLYRLLQKHQVADLGELLEVQERFEAQLNQYSENDRDIEILKKEVDALNGALLEEAGVLSQARKKIAPKLSERVMEQLAELSMPNAVLDINIETKKELGPNGIDKVVYLFSANKGTAPKPLKDVASGGELSRLALSLKSIVAGALALPTLIFDEIDTGISGQVSLKMGGILKSLADQHQVICITHTPQIAARASRHFNVRKDELGATTRTEITVLDGEARTLELAKMLSGDPPSPAALQNAAELQELP